MFLGEKDEMEEAFEEISLVVLFQYHKLRQDKECGCGNKNENNQHVGWSLMENNN